MTAEQRSDACEPWAPLYDQAALDAVQSVASGMFASKAALLEAETERLRAALREVHNLAGWQTDDSADIADDSPDDMVAHINGLIRQACATVLWPTDLANLAKGSK